MYQTSIYTLVTFLAMINPVEAAAMFATVTAGRTAREKRQIAWKATNTAAVILLGFGIVGNQLMRTLGISLAAFKIAGGLLLLQVGFGMVSAAATRADRDDAPAPQPDPSVFPLAIPIISGPGALTVSVTLFGRAEGKILTILLIASIALVVFGLTYLAMRASGILVRVLGPSGVEAVGKVLGIIVAAIAIQLVIDGLSQITGGFVHVS